MSFLALSCPLCFVVNPAVLPASCVVMLVILSTLFSIVYGLASQYADQGMPRYLYNDAVYLAEELSKLSEAWKERQDVTARARNMLRLGNDVKTMQNFANRSYANEMHVQRTVLQDLLGASQSVVQQEDAAAALEAGTRRIREMATLWEGILARSVWLQAVGSLVDALATRVIADVLDLPSIGQDEAYRIASLIAAATALDDLFLPSKLGAARASRDEASTTDQYAPNWPRLKYLGEVLQSDLGGIRRLWCEDRRSYYWNEDEVVDLIHASFEDNARTRQTIREIRSTPCPAVDL